MTPDLAYDRSNPNLSYLSPLVVGRMSDRNMTKKEGERN